MLSKRVGLGKYKGVKRDGGGGGTVERFVF